MSFAIPLLDFDVQSFARVKRLFLAQAAPETRALSVLSRGLAYASNHRLRCRIRATNES